MGVRHTLIEETVTGLRCSFVEASGGRGFIHQGRPRPMGNY
jgi:hypothetical protein